MTTAAKTSAAVALAIAVGFTAVTLFAAAQERAALLRMGDRAMTETTTLLGSVVAGGVRFGRTEAIERAYAGFVADPQVALSRIETYKADGTRLTQWRSQRFADHGIETPAELLTGPAEAVTRDLGTHVLVAVPAGVGNVAQLVYSNCSPSRNKGCCPTIPKPRTSCTALSPSVMCQWRAMSCTGVVPTLRIVTV